MSPSRQLQGILLPQILLVYIYIVIVGCTFQHPTIVAFSAIPSSSGSFVRPSPRADGLCFHSHQPQRPQQRLRRLIRKPRRHHVPRRITTSTTTTTSSSRRYASELHWIDDEIVCREVPVDVMRNADTGETMRVTVFEATAETQTFLVDQALLMDGDEDSMVGDNSSGTTTDISTSYDQQSNNHSVYNTVESSSMRRTIKVERDDDCDTSSTSGESALLTTQTASKQQQQQARKYLTNSDPYGTVLWPAAFTLASYLLQNASAFLYGKHIIELGTGTGLVALTALQGGAASVTATDYETLPLRLVQYAAQQQYTMTTMDNHSTAEMHKSRTAPSLRTRLFDVCNLTEPLAVLWEDFDDGLVKKTTTSNSPASLSAPSLQLSTPLSTIAQAEASPINATFLSTTSILDTKNIVVVAADILYEPRTGRAMAHRVVEALRANCTVLLADSPGRMGRPAFLQTLQQHYGFIGAQFRDTVGRTVDGPRHELICGKTSPTVGTSSSSSNMDTPEQTSNALKITMALMELFPDTATVQSSTF